MKKSVLISVAAVWGLMSFLVVSIYTLPKAWNLLVFILMNGRKTGHNTNPFLILGFFALSLLGSILISIFIPKKKPNPLSALLTQQSYLKFAVSVAKLVVFEEFLFRLLFWDTVSWLLPDIRWVFWSALAINSALFGWVHMFNFDPKDRKWYLGSPQAFGAVLLSTVYVQWGFLGAVALHLIMDVFLLSSSILIDKALKSIQELLITHQDRDGA